LGRDVVTDLLRVVADLLRVVANFLWVVADFLRVVGTSPVTSGTSSETSGTSTRGSRAFAQRASTLSTKYLFITSAASRGDAVGFLSMPLTDAGSHQLRDEPLGINVVQA
jgi:hypothetical protein